MTEKQAFGVVVRAFGLLALMASILYLISAVYVRLTPGLVHPAPTAAYFLIGAAGL